MLERKLLTIIGLVAFAVPGYGQDWRPAGTTSDGWKPAATLASPEAPSVSQFRNVRQSSSLDQAETPPVRTSLYDERMPPTDRLPPPNPSTTPAKPATLVPPRSIPKAMLLRPTTPESLRADPNWLYPAPAVAATTTPTTTPPLPDNFHLMEVFRPRGQVWVTPEYLLWRTSGMKIPPIATSSPVGTGINQAGVLGQPTTTLLFGDQKILGDWRSGLRLNAGFWVNDEQTLGFDGGFFYLGTKSKFFSASSVGDPLLGRPFLDASNNQQNADLIANSTRNADGSLSPDRVGTIGFRASSSLWGYDFNFRGNLWKDDSLRVDGLVGFRYLQLRDITEIGETVQFNDPNAGQGIAFGTTYGSIDSFRTRSNFYGGQLGLNAQYNWGRWTVGMLGKVAIGDSVNQVSINGSTIVNAPGSTSQVSQGGLFAQATNIGRYNANAFAVVPEFGLNLSYQVTDQIRIFAGYSGMYWSNVVRSGEQIDFAVNSTQIPRGGTNTLAGPARPSFIMKETGFWASGVSCGLEFCW